MRSVFGRSIINLYTEYAVYYITVYNYSDLEMISYV